MRAAYHAALIAAVIVAASAAYAGGIDPGLWKITSRTTTGGVIGPPHESSKCLTAEQTDDLATTFSPVPSTINSVCAPIERSLNGPRLSWHLVCKGQLDMELTGEFDFDSPHHYSGTVRTRAEMAGMLMVDSQNTVEGQWLSACPQ
ncbi:MAG TPA: DUF3617 family protein [Xanthobacteraceae bacterium]|nr:DUF3617 family protein [Xanthobacteraceae bacterium]